MFVCMIRRLALSLNLKNSPAFSFFMILFLSRKQGKFVITFIAFFVPNVMYVQVQYDLDITSWLFWWYKNGPRIAAISYPNKCLVFSCSTEKSFRSQNEHALTLLYCLLYEFVSNKTDNTTCILSTSVCI